jgi:hypothetical protein
VKCAGGGEEEERDRQAETRQAAPRVKSRCPHYYRNGAGATRNRREPTGEHNGRSAGFQPAAEPASSQPADAPRPAAAEEGTRAAAAEPSRVAAPDAEATRPTETGGGIAGSAFNRYMDIQNVEQRYQEHIAAGMAPAEAVSLAVAQQGRTSPATGSDSRRDNPLRALSSPPEP